MSIVVPHLQTKEGKGGVKNTHLLLCASRYTYEHRGSKPPQFYFQPKYYHQGFSRCEKIHAHCRKLFKELSKDNYFFSFLTSPREKHCLQIRHIPFQASFYLHLPTLTFSMASIYFSLFFHLVNMSWVFSPHVLSINPKCNFKLLKEKLACAPPPPSATANSAVLWPW